MRPVVILAAVLAAALLLIYVGSTIADELNQHATPTPLVSALPSAMPSVPK